MSYVQQLNNWMQSTTKAQTAVTYDYTQGTAPRVWTVICKVDGVEKGRATDRHKDVAKEQAAKRALEALGVITST
ncbi:hypothetical protein K474DRAFT_1656982 [Panus rudis PR-1116 ss-1]|nr:hypothetical protein K474DRAFT_1656982 [Panus rudis PR-1116 ss-1]